MESWYHFLLLGLALSTPVGPANIEMIKLGINRGFYLSWLVGIGDVISNLFIMMILFYGLSDWLKSEWIRAFFSLIGGYFLIRIGLKSEKSSISLLSVVFSPSAQAMMRGFCLGLINPSDFLSWLAIYSTISQHTPQWIWSAFMWLLIGAGLWNSLLSFAISHCRHYVKPKLVSTFMRVASFILIIYGGSFIVKAISYFLFP
ncbi:LysE family translocator [Laceyella putida]|uniref:LysE family translocator n=1 Tax=Laceyella putida TaxID=110101 RepID=A0ABW2RLR7_9BACL